LDGTLVDTLEGLAASVNFALKNVGCPARTTEEIRGFIGEGVTQLVRDALGPSRESLLGKALPFFTAHYGEDGSALSALYPGALEALKSLSGFALGMVTNKPEAPALKIMKALGVAAPFKVFICGDTLPVKKPDPATILEACRRLGVPPASALMVGDAPGDVKAAHGAGALACGVSFGYRPVVELKAAGADFIVDRLTDIAALLEEKS
jgi:phosphoglycolate phosphatase